MYCFSMLKKLLSLHTTMKYSKNPSISFNSIRRYHHINHTV
jgi:hypothetical protein